MNKRIIIYLVLLILGMLLIYNFSSKDNISSNSTSKNLINSSLNIYKIITNKKIDNKIIVKKLNYPVRKCAHFILYFILGIIIYKLLSQFTDKKIIISIIFCFIYACSDEYHQYFVNGRTGQLLDVFIDTLGSSISILLINKRSEKNEK